MCCPTYNEKENIANLIEQVLALGENYYMLIVDDNSPDGTGQIVEQLKSEKYNEHLQIIHRKAKLGLGTAYIRGFKYLLEEDEENFDIIGSMDADFSHNPKYIPNMIKMLEEYDVIIGSRYVDGGRAEKCSFFRIIISHIANWFAHTMLGLQNKDCTAGFRVYHRNVLKNIGLDEIKAEGYSFLIEIAYRCQQKGYKIGESPIVFMNRELGKSKISRKEIFNAINTIFRLSFGKKSLL